MEMTVGAEGRDLVSGRESEDEEPGRVMTG